MRSIVGMPAGTRIRVETTSGIRWSDEAYLYEEYKAEDPMVCIQIGPKPIQRDLMIANQCLCGISLILRIEVVEC